MIDFFFILQTFYGELGTGCYLLKKKINRNSFDEECSFYNAGIARLSYAVTLQDGRTQW